MTFALFPRTPDHLRGNMCRHWGTCAHTSFFGTLPPNFSHKMFEKQGGMLAFFVLCLRLSHKKCLKNKTECPPFVS